MNRPTSSEAAEAWVLDDVARAPRDTVVHLDGHREQAVRPIAGGGFLVAPNGAWLGRGSDEFFVALGDPDPDYDAVSFAVKNLGFIFVQVVAASLVDITLHSRNVAPGALSSLQQWAQSFQSRFFRLNDLEDLWTSQIFTKPAQVICHLFEIADCQGHRE